MFTCSIPFVRAALTIVVMLRATTVSSFAAEPVDFAMQVQPVLSKYCYACHGPDQQKSGLRLDIRKDALKPADSDERAIVPGDAAGSRLMKVLDGRDEEFAMPPKGARPTPQQVELIKRWINEGATYNRHWSFVAPRRPALPKLKNEDFRGWPRNAIDHFVLDRLEREGLSPSPEADPHTLIRRVYLDLIGIPPTPEETDAFVKEWKKESSELKESSEFRVPSSELKGSDPTRPQSEIPNPKSEIVSTRNPEPGTRNPTPAVYERLVDRLLASPHYGERWARRWLDLARYADTNGYEKDRIRSIWPYRDWVIRAINDDMPFDQFTIEQLAGDMLDNRWGYKDGRARPGEPPNIGLGPLPFSSLIATGFHRNTMLNEEGGIDVEEFRYHAVADRVSTTAAVWLGLTVGCAQCHTHKYDPITHKEYFRLFAFFNNADEPEVDVETLDIRRQWEAYGKQRQALRDDMLRQFPAKLPEALEWSVVTPKKFESRAGVKATVLEDKSIRIDPGREVKDIYTITAEVDLLDIAAIRIEALPDPALPGTGPGLAANGNFVISEVTIDAKQRYLRDAKPEPVKIDRAEADVSQQGFDISAAIDGNAQTGWAIDDGSGRINQARTATFHFATPINPKPDRNNNKPQGAIMTIAISQQHGSQHMLGRFRIHAARRAALPADSALSEEEQRKRQFEFQYHRWLDEQKKTARYWYHLFPLPHKITGSNGGTFKQESDGTITVTGDNPNQNVYTIETVIGMKQVNAIRLEVIADPRLPAGGPGRAPLFSEGDFHLGEFEMHISPLDSGEPFKRVIFSDAFHSFAQPGRSAKLAIDGDPDTAWSIKGGTGKSHQAVFILKDPPVDDRRFTARFTLDQRHIHQMTIGKFRLSVPRSDAPVKASSLPGDLENMLAGDGPAWNGSDQNLREYFARTTPLLADWQREYEKLEATKPRAPRTLVMQERSRFDRRVTRIHKRGEFLQPGEAVEPGVPDVLGVVHPFEPQLPPPHPTDPTKFLPTRLDFARWLVDPKNPLVGRVVMNRQWEVFFGRGLVQTSEDFGLQGDKPSHPELLDWLAVEFTEKETEDREQKTPRSPRTPVRGFSMKQMHKLIVMSATYRQSSRITPQLLRRDPENILLARGPRLRMEAEMLRDSALLASGLLSRRIGGPSVFPPQPEGVTSLGYGGFNWPAATGEDRYRRGLYTFAKRTTPYAAFLTFDGPTGETCLVRRGRSNNPLQALTMMNDPVFVEAAQALARRVLSEKQQNDDARIDRLFRLVLVRPPGEEERTMLTAFLAAQRERLNKGELEAAKIAGNPPGNMNVDELAAWTVLARSVMNLDEAVTKE